AVSDDSHRSAVLPLSSMIEATTRSARTAPWRTSESSDLLAIWKITAHRAGIASSELGLMEPTILPISSANPSTAASLANLLGKGWMVAVMRGPFQKADRHVAIEK